MNATYDAVWPRRLAPSLPIPQTNVARNLEVSAMRYPDRPAIMYYGSAIWYGELWRDVEALAGYLQHDAGVKTGDRVVLFMQNAPQFIVAYYAIVRANAVVVPLNPMYVTDELERYSQDCGARVAIVGSELLERVAPLMGKRLNGVIAATYGDAVKGKTDLKLPAAVAAPAVAIDIPGAVAWRDALALRREPGPIVTGADDLACMPYTSGTTGKSKGCAHTHRSVQTTTVTAAAWGNMTAGVVNLSTLPFFHVTGMIVDMNAVLYVGGTLILMTRWDAQTALELVRRFSVTGWTAIVTMVIDLLSQPSLDASSLASLKHVTGGGAALPGPVSDRLFELTGLRYIEGYGLSETISTTHVNPPDFPKSQCLGIPTFGVDSRVIDPETLEEVAQGKTGEIIISGSQIMREYWGQPEASAEVFLQLDGKRFLRTGDLGYIDEQGYFFMVDRLKRMINASGFKVWPAEVESILFEHPAVREACVIGATDPRRGETTKAVIVLHDGSRATADDIIAWSKQKMAAYKVPTIVQFVDALPRSGTGKVQWRVLQEEEMRRSTVAVT